MWRNSAEFRRIAHTFQAGTVVSRIIRIDIQLQKLSSPVTCYGNLQPESRHDPFCAVRCFHIEVTGCKAGDVEGAIPYHLDRSALARRYSPFRPGVAPDLRYRLAPIEPVLARVNPLLIGSRHLSEMEFDSSVGS